MAQGLRERPRVVAATVLLVAAVIASSLLVGIGIGGGFAEEAVERAPAEANLQALREQLDASEKRITELQRQLDVARQSAARHAGRAKRLERQLQTRERARARQTADRAPRKSR